jgi:hypothetical protein
MKPLSNQAFDAVTRLFHSVSGIKLTEAKHALVTGRLQRLATEAGETDLEHYVDKLLRGGAPAQEMTKLIDRLTTNETYFFREPQHYNDLADRVAKVPAGQEFSVWSAASSSGEEAYSVAMLLSEQLAHALVQPRPLRLEMERRIGSSTTRRSPAAPVSASATMSRPDSAAGIDSAWMRVGADQPSEAAAEHSGATRPSEEKVGGEAAAAEDASCATARSSRARAVPSPGAGTAARAHRRPAARCGARRTACVPAAQSARSCR